MGNAKQKLVCEPPHELFSYKLLSLGNLTNM